MMRFFQVVTVVLAMAAATPVAAADEQGIEYANREDQFVVNLPNFPKIEEITYVSEFDTVWKGHRYTSSADGYVYRMTVIDMSNTSLVPGTEVYRNVGRPGLERRGAMAYAAGQLRQTGKVTLDVYQEIQIIPGIKLEIALPDGRVNIAELHTHDKRLYIWECISPKDALPAYGSQASFTILDAQGYARRYQDNDYSFPDYMVPMPVAPETRRIAGPTTTEATAKPAVVE